MPKDFVFFFCKKRPKFTCWHGEEGRPSRLLEREVDGAEHSVAHPHVQHQVVVPGHDEVLLHQRDTHLSMMAMTADTFRFIASSIASMASALATGSFKSRSPS